MEQRDELGSAIISDELDEALREIVREHLKLEWDSLMISLGLTKQHCWSADGSEWFI